MGKTLLLTLVLTLAVVLAAMVLLSVKVILKKNGRFSSMHIGDSKAMRKRGIGCVQSQHRQGRKDKKHAIDVKEL